MKFNNINQLLDYFNFTSKHDILIAEIVSCCESAVAKHYHDYKQELEYDDLILPTVECHWNGNKIIIQYDPHGASNMPKIKQITQFNQKPVSCPLHVKS